MALDHEEVVNDRGELIRVFYLGELLTQTDDLQEFPNQNSTAMTLKFKCIEYEVRNVFEFQVDVDEGDGGVLHGALMRLENDHVTLNIENLIEQISKSHH